MQSAEYRVKHKNVKQVSATGWDESLWAGILPCAIRHHMGARPDHFPRAEVKAVYDREAISLMFRVADRYVVARAAADQDEVYRDSCVEFFFTPGTDPGLGYFNLEINCGGTMLFHFQERPRQDRVLISQADCRKVVRAHSLPRIITPEITEEVVWTVSLRLPLAPLEKYCPVVHPGPGVVWRANFYKCADGSSHPHWLTWAKVASCVPDFHVPESFGHLVFEP